MPKTISAKILEAKTKGWPKANLLHMASDQSFYLTDNAWDVEYDAGTGSQTYLANGLFLSVDSGAMSAGSESNQWKFSLSAVDNTAYSQFLGQQLNNRWVYHYVVYFEKLASGYVVAGVEPKKFGQIVSTEDESSRNSASIVIKVTNPFSSDDSPGVMTNKASQHKFFGDDDNVFQFAHEVSTKVTVPSASLFNLDERIPGDDIP